MKALSSAGLAVIRRRDAIHLWVVISIAIMLAASWLAINLILPLHRPFYDFAALTMADWWAEFIYVWLIILLWLAYRHWRASLRREAELQRILANIWPEALIVVAPDQTIHGGNAAVQTMFGHRPEEILGKKTDLLYSVRRVAPDAQTEARSLDAAGFQLGYATARKKNGETFPVEFVTSKLQGVSGAVVLIRDITERVKAEQALQAKQIELQHMVEDRTVELLKANRELMLEIEERRRVQESLRESEENFRALVENAMSGILIVSGDDRIVYSNPRAAVISGANRPGEMIGMRVADLLGAGWKERFATAEEADGQTHKEGVVIRRDGGQIPVDIAVAATPWKGVPSRIVLFEDITERKEAEAKLIEGQNALRYLASELSVAEEAERRRIATNLHDGIGQLLALCKMKLTPLSSHAAIPENGREKLQEVRDLIERAISETRLLTFQLSPPVLHELGFDAALEWLTERMTQQHKLPVSFQTDRQSKPLAEATRITLFQGARELILNAVKHAEARWIRTSCRRLKNNINVTVEDDGKGFEARFLEQQFRRNANFGLFYIRERLHFLGGKMIIETAPGRGCRVTLVAPLAAENGPETGGGQ